MRRVNEVGRQIIEATTQNAAGDVELLRWMHERTIRVVIPAVDQVIQAAPWLRVLPVQDDQVQILDRGFLVLDGQTRRA